MEANDTIEHYPNWLAKKGNPNTVILIKFKGYVEQNGSRKSYNYNYTRYNCEEWLCQIGIGERAILRFRVPAEKTKSFSYSYSPASTVTEPLNPVIDSRYKMNVDPADKFNKSVFDHNQRDKEIIKKLKKILKTSKNIIMSQGIRLRINYMTKPHGSIHDGLNYGTVADWRNWRLQNKALAQCINTLLNEENEKSNSN